MARVGAPAGEAHAFVSNTVDAFEEILTRDRWDQISNAVRVPAKRLKGDADDGAVLGECGPPELPGLMAASIWRTSRPPGEANDVGPIR